VGDKLYGPDENLYLAFVQGCLTADNWATLLLPHQALHARQVSFSWRGQMRSFQAEPEEWFRKFAED